MLSPQISVLLAQMLSHLLAGQPLGSTERQQLEEWALLDTASAAALGITAETVQSHIEDRSRWFGGLYPTVYQFCQPLLPISPALIAHLLWSVWLPLAMQMVAHHHFRQRPVIQGIVGMQGTGKTTLAALLQLILKHLGYQSIGLSLDDLYKTYRDRQSLREQDPRLLWRGPPGTHDIALGVQVLDQLCHAQPGQVILIPRFDKSAHGGAGDRTEPEQVTDVNIVLFEGWFVGVRPIAPDRLATAPAPILSAADQEFAQDSNARLHDYLPLWEQLDHLMVLNLTDYQLSQQWRIQAEQRMIASGKPGLSVPDLEQFVEYFWKSLHPALFIPPLVQQPGLADLVLDIDPNHLPSRIYKPGWF
jgi:D-glycerate 3-kinase